MARLLSRLSTSESGGSDPASGLTLTLGPHTTPRTMIQLDIYCGLITGDKLDTVEGNRRLAQHLALGMFPHGHTIIEAQGRWDQGGTPITEPTLIIRLILEAADEYKARRLAGAYKEAARQEAVMIIKTDIDASFV